MSHLPELQSVLHATDHSLIASLRFLDDYIQQAVAHRHFHHGNQDSCLHHFVPRFDLEEHDDTYELTGALPGARKENIVVEANDNRNIQVSGWVGRGSNISTDDHDLTDPTVKVQHHDVAKTPTESHFQSLGEGLNMTKAPPPTTNGEQHAHKPTQATPSTTKPAQKVETARFGDKLDPNAMITSESGGKKPGQNAEAPKKSSSRTLIAERQFGQFHRIFHFPSPIVKDEVTAWFENGILHVMAPKAVVPPSTKVEVKYTAPYFGYIF